MLLALQLLMPGISFLGHLCGILVGFMHKKGVTSLFLSPPRSFLVRFERRMAGSCLMNCLSPRYVPVPAANPVIHEHFPWVARLNNRLCGASSEGVNATSSQIVTGVHRGGSGSWARFAQMAPTAPPPRHNERQASTSSVPAEAASSFSSTSDEQKRGHSISINPVAPEVEQLDDEGAGDSGVRGAKRGLVGTLLASVRGEGRRGQNGRGDYARLEDKKVAKDSFSSQDLPPPENLPGSAAVEMSNTQIRIATSAISPAISQGNTNVRGKSRLLALVPRATQSGKEGFLKSQARDREKTVVQKVNQKLKLAPDLLITSKNVPAPMTPNSVTHQQQAGPSDSRSRSNV